MTKFIGNLNNFPSIQECISFCSSSACAPGEITYKDVNVKKVVECSTNIVNSCPMDYSCRHNPLTTKFVCCGTPASDVCPEGEKAYINPMDESVKECTINIAGSCPSGFLCRFSPTHNRYYCCASKSGNVCPAGKALYRQQKTLQPTRCTLSSQQNECPDGYTCQSRVLGVLQGYCCSAQSVCRGGSDFLTDEKTKMPQICMIGAFVSCPSGYRCSKSQNSLTGYCCKGGIVGVTEGCPKDLPFAYTKQKTIVACDPFNPEDKKCPTHYSCQYAVSFQRYQCCGKEPIDEDEEDLSEHESGCLNDQVAFFNEGTNSPQVCTASGPNTCPLGFFCQFSDKNKQFQCCAQKAGCPSDGVAYVGISGQPETCKPNFTSCPVGFSCQKTRNNKDICCTINNPKAVEPEVLTQSTETSPIEITESTTEFSSTGREIGIHGKFAEIKPSTKIKPTQLLTINHKSTEVNCKPNEQLKNGVCVTRQIGDPCLTSDQCPKTSVCSSHSCRCPDGTKKENNMCIPDFGEENYNRKSQISGEVEEQKVKKCKADEILYRGHCLKKAYLGENCVAKEQCQNGAFCYRSKCRCKPNMGAYKSVCLDNVCGGNNFRLPELDPITSVIVCSEDRTVCSVPHRCIFSKIIDDYICCRSTITQRQIPATSSPEDPFYASTQRSRHTTISRQRKNCPNNEIPLLFANTNQPIKCTPHRACPKDYFCHHNICCKGTTRAPLAESGEE